MSTTDTEPVRVVDKTATLDQGDYGGDEETTLPPPPDEPGVAAGPPRPSAVGDFRTSATTFSALGDGACVEVRLISDLGDHAHFGMDRPLAALVAKELERQLTEASHEERQHRPWLHRQDRFLFAAPPKLAQLAAPGTDVFWTIDEAPWMRVSQEDRGDRIVLHIRSDNASLGISMQGGVAAALQRFLARAGRASRTRVGGF